MFYLIVGIYFAFVSFLFLVVLLLGPSICVLSWEMIYLRESLRIVHIWIKS